MAVDFFVRFNLHRSPSSLPLSVEALRPHLKREDEELACMLREIDAAQAERAEALRKKYPEETTALCGKKVLFLGDSITSDNLGYRGTVTGAAKLLGIDGSISGGTSSMLLHGAKLSVEKERPDLVSLMVGSNDSVSIEEMELHQVSPSEYERNVRQMVAWAKRSGARVLLFEIPPVVEARFQRNFSGQAKLQSNETVRSYNERLQGIAREAGVELIGQGWLSEDEANYEKDGIHLSVQGHEAFAERWLLKAYEIIKQRDV